MKLNKYWFKPKRYGYGAEPITWEGWILVAAFIGYLLYISTFLVDDESSKQYLWYVFGGIVVIWYVSKIKTEEDWKWNWGKRDV